MVVQQRRDYCSQQRRSLVSHWRCDNHYALGKRERYSRLHHSQPDIAQFGIDIRSNVFDSKKNWTEILYVRHRQEQTKRTKGNIWGYTSDFPF